MKPVESITKSLAKELDKLNNIREDSLRLSREIIRSCSKSIRNVHRNELKDAKTYLKEAEKKSRRKGTEITGKIGAPRRKQRCITN